VPWQLQRIELCFIINAEIFKQYFFETEFLWREMKNILKKKFMHFSNLISCLANMCWSCWGTMGISKKISIILKVKFRFTK
jgi:hypothetical protein